LKLNKNGKQKRLVSLFFIDSIYYFFNFISYNNNQRDLNQEPRPKGRGM